MIDFYYMEMNMVEKKKKWFRISIWLLAIAVIYTVLVKYVDVKAIGPSSTKVGFATFLILCILWSSWSIRIN